MKSVLLAAFLTMNTLASLAQSTVEARVITGEGKPFENATVVLRRASDSSLYKSNITDASGLAEFKDVPQGEYLISGTGAGYLQKDLAAISVTNEKTAQVEIKLEADAKAMQEVTVTAKKPYLQKLHDRLVVNVENSIVNAGSTAFEVLERAPGVLIDQNDQIALRGKQGVIIMIDSKPSPLNGADLANYLRALPSSAIERIDLITNPSSKYDAAGNAGIIDIRMKKDKRMGTNGSITAGYGQGVYPKANAGITFNHRKQKLNLFGNYNYVYRKHLNHLILDRNFYREKNFTGADFKDNYSTAPANGHTLRFGADYNAGKRSIIGLIANAGFTDLRRNNRNSSLVINDSREIESSFRTNADNSDDYQNYLFNINFKHNFRQAGRELTADADYGLYNNLSNSTTHTRYFDVNGNPSFPDYILDGRQEGNLEFYTGRVDYIHPLKNKASIEAGLKTSLVSSDNDAKFYDMSTGTPVNDQGKTNHFLYDENNNAAYLNVKKDFKNFDLQLGLRAEQTNIKTYQEIGAVRWDSSYLQLFPTAFFNYRIKEDRTLGISVSRRIDRPGYSQLNPFLFLIDVTTYSTGNPALLPQLTWQYELSYTHKAINLSANYSHTANNQNVAIARFADVFPNIPQGDNVTVQIPVNISTSDFFGLSFSAPLKINKWWSMTNNGDIFYNHFNGKLGDTKLDKGKPGVALRNNNTFTLKNGWSAELSEVYNSSGQYGFMVADPQWGISAGVQKTVLNKKGTVRLNVTDIFWTNLPKAVITYENYVEKWSAKRETRVVNLGFTYRFGKNTVQAARKRTTGSEEERQRAGG